MAEGVVVELPVMIATGWPNTLTRAAPTIQGPVTHGPLPPGGAYGHAATEYGAAIVATACVLTATRGTKLVGVACPPWVHCTDAPT